MRSLIAEYELKAILLCNYPLIVTGKYKKIRRWDQHDVNPVIVLRTYTSPVAVCLPELPIILYVSRIAWSVTSG